MWDKVASHSNSSIAWLEDGRDVTYGELVRDVEQAAAKRLKSMVVSESQNSYECLVGVLAAWLAGGSICLLPSEWPTVWKAQIQKLTASLATTNQEIETFYILPTSGSTGTPKLIPISRSNWTAFMDGLVHEYDWGIGTRVALTFQPSFDPFIAVAVLALTKGATLVPLGRKSHFSIFDFCYENRIEVWASTPSLAHLNLIKNSGRSCGELRESLFTGERLTAGLVRQWRSFAPNSRIENLYGPVETTVWLTRHRFSYSDVDERIPIGVPLSSVELSIENGEIVVRGSQVSVGYIDEHGLRPFNGIYKTGDRGSCENGLYFFDGRIDRQLKVGGRRVEAQQIEDLIDREFGVGSVVGLNSKGHLCAVLERQVQAQHLNRRLRAELPSWYLLHHAYVAKEWPMMASGKLNRPLIAEWLQEDNSNNLIPSQSGESA